MTVGLLTVHLYLPEARSLKQKRSAIKSLKDRLRQRFNISVAEVEHQELHGRCQLGIALVANRDGECRKLLDTIVQYLRLPGPAEMTHYELELIY
jgi:hypothetical protein